MRTGPGRKGPEVVEVIEIREAEPPPENVSRTARPASNAPPTTADEVIGLVKWFNIRKGFGFVALGDQQRDVFVSARTLEKAGLGDLREGQRVRMKIVVKQKGPEAVSIALIE